MGRGVNFPGANFTFSAPADREDIVDLPCFVNGRSTVLCVELDTEELQEVMRTGKVWVTILSGMTFYPCFIGSEASVRSVVVDYGPVWDKGNGDTRKSES